MPKEDVFELHPLGWENDPEEERFNLSTVDYLTPCTYNNYALFFEIDDADKHQAAEILKRGLEMTLGQTRHLCGKIERNTDEGYSFVMKRDDTVRFYVQWVDGPEDEKEYPSFDDIRRSNYLTSVLGDIKRWSVHPMTYGEKPEARPENSPIVASYKANFIRGGLVFIMHHHHYSNDVMGWAGLTHQLAEKCFSIMNKTPPPSWDIGCLDIARFTRPDVPEEKRVDGPSVPERHPGHIPAEMLLFHLPKHKATELKRLASPLDGGSWISTYDAFSAFIWRTITRLRPPVFKPVLSEPLFWSEAIDMRRRMHSPKVPSRIQHNVMTASISTVAPVVQPTASEVIVEWPLTRLAAYVRQMTNWMTQEALDAALDVVATIRDKSSLNFRIDSFPPMSVLQTDHRDTNIPNANFGFAKPATYRHLIDQMTQGVIIIYPSRDPSPGSDEGPEISITYEKSLKENLINDPEWCKYFEYRGVDAVQAP